MKPPQTSTYQSAFQALGVTGINNDYLNIAGNDPMTGMDISNYPPSMGKDIFDALTPYAIDSLRLKMLVFKGIIFTTDRLPFYVCPKYVAYNDQYKFIIRN